MQNTRHTPHTQHTPHTNQCVCHVAACVCNQTSQPIQPIQPTNSKKYTNIQKPCFDLNSWLSRMSTVTTQDKVEWLSRVVKVTKQDSVEWLAKSIVEFIRFSNCDNETGEIVLDPCCYKVWRSAVGVVEAAKDLKRFNVATDVLALGLLSHDMTKRATTFVQHNHNPDSEDLRNTVVYEHLFVMHTNQTFGTVPTYQWAKHMMQCMQNEYNQMGPA